MSKKEGNKNSQIALPLKSGIFGNSAARVVDGRFPAPKNSHMDAVTRRLSSSGVFSSGNSTKKK